jgi:hypothetical protein
MIYLINKSGVVVRGEELYTVSRCIILLLSDKNDSKSLMALTNSSVPAVQELSLARCSSVSHVHIMVRCVTSRKDKSDNLFTRKHMSACRSPVF